MHDHNHWYGGGDALARHAFGKPRSSVPSIPGHVQHGWHLAGACEGDGELRLGLTAYLWSRSAHHHRNGAGLRNHIVIGAPWLYVLDHWTEPSEQPPFVGDLVVFARHGLDGEFAARRLAAQIRERTTGDVTVALTARDVAVPAISDVYRSAGLTVHDLGPLQDPVGGHEPRYLRRLVDLFATHRAVAANHVCSELLYGASFGRTTAIFGDVPPAVRPVTDPSEAAAFAEEELGKEFVLSPDELNDVLEWSRRG